MKEKKFNVNNSNKLIIGISILFCTVILIIGATTAYFTQGAESNIENIVATDELSLEYNDDVNNYMRQELIPSTRENAIIAYNRTEEDKKCLDMNNHSACSIYRFRVKNTGNVSQLLKMSLHPTGNSYKNLKFMLYEVTENGNILIKDTTDLEQFSVEPITMSESYTLGITDEDKEKTFEIVLYIEAQDYDQTGEDSGKQFGAGVRIDSITTGKYIAEGFGPNCWETDPKDRTTLVKFNGIDMDPSVEDDIDSMCNGYVTKEGDYYDITIPSNIGGQEIITIGNNLFNAVQEIDPESGPTSFNKYLNIKNVTISDGITEISDGDISIYHSPFMFIGMGISDSNYEFTINLPSTLKKIGDLSFAFASLKEVFIPKNIRSIGNYAFFSMEGNTSFTNLTFEGALEGTSNLKIIGTQSFMYSAINNLIIPSSLETIGDYAFYRNTNLTQLTFAGALDGTSKLHTIGEFAFDNCDLTYKARENPLILPSVIIAMGDNAFSSNPNLKYIKFNGNTIGFGTSWNGSAQILKDQQ